jgi:hypothetical protein
MKKKKILEKNYVYLYASTIVVPLLLMNVSKPEHLYALYLLSHQEHTFPKLLQSNVKYVVFLLGQAIEQEECPIISHSVCIPNISLVLVVLLFIRIIPFIKRFNNGNFSQFFLSLEDIHRIYTLFHTYK